VKVRALDKELGWIQKAVSNPVQLCKGKKEWVAGPAWKKFTIRCRDLKRDGEVHS
jgi:hypothetical protein